jgi:hypothetical protein
VFDNRVLGKVLGVRGWKLQQGGEKCIMTSFTIFKGKATLIQAWTLP